MAPRAEQTNSCVVSWICATAHPVCSACAPCLTVADNTRVYPHMYRTVVRASSRGLSLMLMSRRKVKAGFMIGWTCPQSCRAQHSWFAFQAKRVPSGSRLVRHLLRPPSRLYHTQSRLDHWRLLWATMGSLVRQYHRFQQWVWE